MENVKRAIILDMDETLEQGEILDNTYQRVMCMTLRPNLDELINKLKEAKENEIDIVLCTTAKQQWVDRFLALKPEFKEIFDKIFTRDNKNEWKILDEEKYPLESAARLQGYDYRNGKPVTTFGYNSILFIDDNKTEGYRLETLFEITQGKLDRDVTFFTGYRYSLPSVRKMFNYIAATKNDEELSKMLIEYLQRLRNENGCLIMSSVIDDFIRREYKPGLNFIDNQYKGDYQQYKKETDELSEKMNDKVYNLVKELRSDGLDLIEIEPEIKEKYESFFETDKKYPYEGIEVLLEKSKNKEQLESLVGIATEMRRKLEDAQELLGKYQQQEGKNVREKQ